MSIETESMTLAFRGEYKGKGAIYHYEEAEKLLVKIIEFNTGEKIIKLNSEYFKHVDFGCGFGFVEAEFPEVEEG